MEVGRFNIDKLEGQSNWVDWKFQVRIHLQAHGLMPAVEGTLKKPTPINVTDSKIDPVQSELFKNEEAAYYKIEYMAQSVIVSALNPEVRKLVNMCTTASDIWSKLVGIFEQRSEQRQDRLFNEFFCIKEKCPDDNIAAHIAKLEKLWFELNDETWKEDKVKLPESLFLNRVLNTLPSEYAEFVNAWESVPKEQRTLSVLRERLCTVEIRLSERGSLMSEASTSGFVASQKHRIDLDRGVKSTSFKGQHQYNQQHTRREKSKKGVSCFRCQGPHFRSQCPLVRSDREGTSKKSAFYGDKVLFNNNEGELWVADSGATQHVTFRRDWFSSWETFQNPPEIYVGNGQSMKALGKGNINIKMLVKGKWEDGYLENVWFVPEAARNLFSILMSVDKGMTASLNRDTCSLFKGNKLMATAKRKGGLYLMHMKVVEPEQVSNSLPCSVVALAEPRDTLQLWHERLGHQNNNYVASFLKNRGIDVELNKEFCEACLYGKQHRLSFGVRQERSKKPGDVVHADVCGPMPVTSVGGARYFLCFKDDFSKFRFVYFLKEKSEVKTKLVDFLSKAKVLGHVVKELITDGGREFCCKEIHEVASKFGFNHRVVMPYCPEQNGAAERENRTLVESARSMIHAKRLPECLWAEAVNTSAYVLNRSAPTSIKGKSPIDLWTGKQSQVDHLRVFGTTVFVHVPKQNRKKWDKKSIKGQLVGYCGDRDGYRVWVPEKRQVILSRDVIFKPEVLFEETDKPSTDSVEFSLPDPSSILGDTDARGEVRASSAPRPKELDEEGAGKIPYGLRDRASLKKPDFFGEWVTIGFLNKA